MESTGTTITTLPNPSSSSNPVIILIPCAACKLLRRRCTDKCVLAPYFPPTDPLKFTMAHRVFGASNIIKFLQELPESQRADAVSAMVYEASARMRDPVYGSTGVICHLLRQVSDLQAELAKAQAKLLNIKAHKDCLMEFNCMEIMAKSPQHQPQPLDNCNISCDLFEAYPDPDPFWEPNLWT
ncbi:LOB domain-containing protein 1-like [Dioscorea cayenensis subsp. rotundata]|uniref:LOB domain-containing protein 1-like n=1 Tax=Dioscorea cayennensis subsp. rotundata TaxID=55577 RepID=A0AB40D006_DIOCR|nr:LOB domain-containing protein 1-like [Dioscorea cayenensis subsp. rotundata]